MNQKIWEKASDCCDEPRNTVDTAKGVAKLNHLHQNSSNGNENPLVASFGSGLLINLL